MDNAEMSFSLFEYKALFFFLNNFKEINETKTKVPTFYQTLAINSAEISFLNLYYYFGEDGTVEKNIKTIMFF